MTMEIIWVTVAVLIGVGVLYLAFFALLEKWRQEGPDSPTANTSAPTAPAAHAVAASPHGGHAKGRWHFLWWVALFMGLTALVLLVILPQMEKAAMNERQRHIGCSTEGATLESRGGEWSVWVCVPVGYLHTAPEAPGPSYELQFKSSEGVLEDWSQTKSPKMADRSYFRARGTGGREISHTYWFTKD